MTITLYYIAFIVIVMISGLSVRWFNFADKGIIKFLLPFSGAYLLGVSFFHLVPEVFRSDLPQPGVFILLGYLIQIGLDYFSKGIEHGHVHVNKASNQFPWAVFLSLCLHSLFEGMPAIEHHHGHDHGHHHVDHEINIPFVSGVMLHKIPVALVLGSLFVQLNISIKKTYLYLFLFALTFPLGSLFSIFIGDSLLGEIENIHHIISAMVLGVLLHISTIILIESEKNHRYSFYKLLSIIVGFILAWLFAV